MKHFSIRNCVDSGSRAEVEGEEALKVARKMIASITTTIVFFLLQQRMRERNS
jgi:ABC-type glycerol-3-phosphate transport system permease component